MWGSVSERASNIYILNSPMQQFITWLYIYIYIIFLCSSSFDHSLSSASDCLLRLEWTGQDWSGPDQPRADPFIHTSGWIRVRWMTYVWRDRWMGMCMNEWTTPGFLSSFCFCLFLCLPTAVPLIEDRPQHSLRPLDGWILDGCIVDDDYGMKGVS